jgi:hypothetical protein
MNYSEAAEADLYMIRVEKAEDLPLLHLGDSG